MKIPNEFLNKIICGDCIKVMQKLPNECVDLIVTSPPYNLKNSTGNGMKDGRGGKWANAALVKGYHNHNDCMPHEDYVKWQRDCLTEMMRVLKEDGAIFYNHKWRVQGGVLQDRHDIVQGFPVRQIIIWKRKGGINFNKGYYLPTYEVIYLIAKKYFKLRKGANSFTDANIILDPFMGSGTTAIAALNLKRTFVGIDLSPEYCKMAMDRIAKREKTLKIINVI